MVKNNSLKIKPYIFIGFMRLGVLITIFFMLKSMNFISVNFKLLILTAKQTSSFILIITCYQI